MTVQKEPTSGQTTMDTAAFARLLVTKGTPELLYATGEDFPAGSPERAACFKIAAIMSKRSLKAEDVATALNGRAAKWYQDNGYETP